MIWFLYALGVSAIVLFIGWLLPPKRHDLNEYWQKMKEDHIYNAEHIYCRK